MKSALLRVYQTDKALEVAGVWITITDETNEDGTKPEFLIARAGGRNTKYQRVADKAAEPYRAEIAARTLPGDKADAIEAEITVDGVLLDWKNVQDEDGKNIPFERERAIAFLTEVPDARTRINIKAQALDTFRAARREVSSKN